MGELISHDKEGDDVDFISGAEVIRNDYGYWPNFHDDYVDEIRICGENIELVIDTVTKPDNQLKEQYKILLTFEKVKDFHFSGQLYGKCSIILDIIFSKKDNEIEVTIYSSLGTSGKILCQSVSANKI